MKLKHFTIIIALAATKAAAQQCEGDACQVVSVKHNPTPSVALQFTNNSDNVIKIGLKRDLGGCSNPNYYSIAPHKQLYLGIAGQTFCTPFNADFAVDDSQKRQISNVDMRLTGSVSRTGNK